MDTKQYLTESEYEDVVRAALGNIGIPSATADMLLKARWPMDAPGFISELSGRGRLLSTDDLADWLAEVVGDRIDPANLLYEPRLADAALAWAVANGRGRPTVAPVVLAEAPELIEGIQRAGRTACN